MFTELRKTIKLAIPVIIGQLGQVVLGFTDSIMVGRLGATELAASGFVVNIFSIALVLYIGITTGISVNVSQNFGAGKKQECGHYLMNGLLVSFIVVVTIMMILFSFAPFLEVFRQVPAVTKAAAPFYIVIVWSFFPLFIFFSYRQFLDGLGHTVPSMIATFAAIAINFIFNYLLIFGHGGFPRMGLVGAGIATLISRGAMAFGLMVYVHADKKFREYLPKFSFQFSRVKILSILKIGLPSGFQYLFEIGAFSGAGILMGWISVEALAAHQIVLNMAAATFMVAMGMSIASGVRVGQAYGAKSYHQVRVIGLGALWFIISCELFFTAVFILGRYFLPRIYINDTEVLKVAATLMIIAALFQLFDGIQAVSAGLLRGMSDVRVPTAVTFVAYWILGLPLAYILAFKFHLNEVGIWAALAVSLLFAAVFLTFRFLKLNRLKF